MGNAEPITPADLLDMIRGYDLVYPPDGDNCCTADGKRCEPLAVYMGKDPLEVCAAAERSGHSAICSAEYGAQADSTDGALHCQVSIARDTSYDNLTAHLRQIFLEDELQLR
jgi:hypothetical protein